MAHRVELIVLFSLYVPLFCSVKDRCVIVKFCIGHKDTIRKFSSLESTPACRTVGLVFESRPGTLGGPQSNELTGGPPELVQHFRL
jgi:hypothetical protein